MTAATSSTVNSTGFVNFILAELTCAGLRTRLLSAEINSIRTALNGAFITADDAINWLDVSSVILTST